MGWRLRRLLGVFRRFMLSRWWLWRLRGWWRWGWWLWRWWLTHVIIDHYFKDKLIVIEEKIFFRMIVRNQRAGHYLSSVLLEGRIGAFWSCHNKNYMIPSPPYVVFYRFPPPSFIGTQFGIVTRFYSVVHEWFPLRSPWKPSNPPHTFVPHPTPLQSINNDGHSYL